MSRLSLLRRLVTLAWRPDLGLRPAIVLATLVDVVGVLLGTGAPVLLKMLVDHLQARDWSAETVSLAATGFVAAALAPNLIAAAKQVQTTCVVEGLCAHLMLAAVGAQLDPDHADDASDVPGYLVRLPFSLQLIIEGLVWRALPVLAQGGAGLCVVLWAAPPQAAALLGASLILYVWLVDAGGRLLRSKAVTANAACVALSSRLSDVLANCRRVTANGAADFETEALARAVTLRGKTLVSLASASAGGAVFQFAVLSVGLALMLSLCARRILRGGEGVGDLVLLQSYAFGLALPLGGVAAALRQSHLAFETVAGVVQRHAGVDRTRSLTPRTNPLDFTAGLRCRALSKGYGHEPILADVSFSAAPGSLNVVIGANGSGKSTLVRILAGLLEPDAGSVELFGQTLGRLPQSERRRLVLLVPQDVGLLDRSVGENGLYPPTRLGPPELKAILERWRFNEGGQPVDLVRPTGPRGRNLSGGQAQKLELARLTGVSVPLLILDETTSALDLASERAAIEALRAASPGTTVLIVTHTVRLAERADRVIFLKDGRIASQGPHATLLRASPDYRAFWVNEAAS